MQKLAAESLLSAASFLRLPYQLWTKHLHKPCQTPWGIFLQNLTNSHSKCLHTSISLLDLREQWPHRHYKERKPPKLLQLLPEGCKIPPDFSPAHELQICAMVRVGSGTKFSKRIRKLGLSPSLLHSLPGNLDVNIVVNSVDLQRLAQKYGREAMLSFQYMLLLLRQVDNPVPGLPPPPAPAAGNSPAEQQAAHIEDAADLLERDEGTAADMAGDVSDDLDDEADTPLEDLGLVVQRLPVIMREVHIDGGTDKVENAVFMYMPEGRRAVIDIPIIIEGEEDSPAYKRNGSVEQVRDTVPCEVTWDVIPNQPFVIDVSDMDIGGRVWVKHLKPFPGVRVVAKHLMHPVMKMVGKNWRDMEEEKQAAEA